MLKGVLGMAIRIWVTIMVALTMNRWVADTTFQFVLRITGTFAGAVVGLLIWSIGNPRRSYNLVSSRNPVHY